MREGMAALLLHPALVLSQSICRCVYFAAVFKYSGSVYLTHHLNFMTFTFTCNRLDVRSVCVCHCCCYCDPPQFGDQEGVRGVFVALLELLKQKVRQPLVLKVYDNGTLTLWGLGTLLSLLAKLHYKSRRYTERPCAAIR